MIPITVHVRDSRVEEFYIRFAEFLSDVPEPEAAVRLESGIVPAWVLTDEAPAIAARLMKEISGPGHFILRHLLDAARTETAHLSADELVQLSQYPNGKSGIAGILGGVGKAIRRAGLPFYRTPSGASWHYIWDWDGESYSMTPEVARLLRKARPR